MSGIVITYNGSTTAPTAVGTYTVAAKLENDNLYANDVSFDVQINKGSAQLALTNLSKTYNGSAQGATVTTSPSGLNGVTVTYGGLTNIPTAAGTYAVVAKLTNDSYTATDVIGDLVIGKANQAIVFPTFPTKNTSSADFPLDATVNTGFALTYTISNPSVATVYQDVNDGTNGKSTF